MNKRGPDKRTYPFKERILMAAIIFSFLFWLSRYMNIDFWYDEVFSLHNYVFTSLKTTATDYSFPNNHIFFNLIANVYLKIIGVKSLLNLMDRPYGIRLLTLGYTLVTLYYLYLIGKKFFNEFVANLSLIILVSTVPYYNFALQVRGYGLSIMLLCMLLYHLWNFEKHAGLIDGLMVVFSTALCLYTIPLNLYFMLGICLFYFGAGTKTWGARLRASKLGGASEGSEGCAPRRDFYRENVYLVIVFLVGIGMTLAFLLYLPVIDEAVHNRFVESHGLFYLPTLVETLPETLYYFMSERYLIIPIFILGWILYVKFHKEEDLELKRKAACCLVLFLVPFFLSFIRADRPFLRVFVNLAPLFALLVSISMHFLVASIPALRSKKFLVTIVMILYCNITFALSMNKISRHTMSDIEAGLKSQHLYYNYYQAHYYPLKLAGDFSRNYELGQRPWKELVLYDCDEVAMPFYLRKFGVGFSGRKELRSSLTSQKRLYVITAFPNNFEKMIMEEYPQVEYERLNERLQFHNIFRLTGTDKG